jgi:serine/threonine protein kinase
LSLEEQKMNSIENYEIMKNIGEGAFGSVNLALDKARNKKVAIKAVNIIKTC